MEPFLNAFIAYFVIIDPIGVALVFHSLTLGRSVRYGRTMAARSTVISAAVTLLFGFFGNAVLERLGISIDSFRIAGGALLFYTAFVMITGDDHVVPTESGGEERDISVYPLSIPLMAGPGCLTLTVLLFSRPGAGLSESIAVVSAVLIIYGISYALFLASGNISRAVGKVGSNIIKRLLGVLLAALSVQFIADGIRGFMK